MDDPLAPIPPETTRTSDRGTTGAHAGTARPMGFELPTGKEPHHVRQRLETLEHLLERSFRIPGVNYPVGLDAIVGLVPVVGDIVTAAMGAYFVWEAKNIGLPKWKLWRMAGNVAIDSVIGAVPLVGDAFDLAFRSNTRNLRIVKKHLDKHHPAARTLEG